MYSTCLFCHSDLGENSELEMFPVGRRLAFDAAKGRLWVVCRRCERWNLTPVEERWEAIEECERRFRGTTLRVSTDNIGLARLASGLELVRVGSALRPELAAWRYGDQFGRRRRKHMLLTGAGVVVGGAFLIAGPVTGIIAGGSWGLFNLANTAYSMYEERRVRARLRIPGQDVPVVLRRKHLARVRLIPGPEESPWILRVAFARVSAESLRTGTAVKPRNESVETELRGPDALQAAGLILPQINDRGASRGAVARAVKELEAHPDPTKVFSDAARRFDRSDERGQSLETLPLEIRLALEMVSHEDTERRAMQGELALLEAAWRQAEEIAAIADDLLTPSSDDAWLAENKGAGLRAQGRGED
jgi:hypothetical protein